jgi:intracellular multiplication protein IcmT
MAHWRDTYKPARLFFIDARAGIPLLACLLHIRIWSVLLAAAFIVLFWYLERIGLDAASAMRAARSWVVGNERPAKFPGKQRGRIDYERRPNPIENRDAPKLPGFGRRKAKAARKPE